MVKSVPFVVHQRVLWGFPSQVSYDDCQHAGGTFIKQMGIRERNEKSTICIKMKNVCLFFTFVTSPG